MMKKLIYSGFILFILMAGVFSPSIFGESENPKKDKYKDSDKDGIPDFWDKEDIPNGTKPNSTNKTEVMSRESVSGDNWSFSYDSDFTYGAWIGYVYWKNNKYIHRANVPWVKINNILYEIPNDFMTREVGCIDSMNYFIVYMYYSIYINGVYHEVEIHWCLQKSTINNAAKINATAYHYANDKNSYNFYAPFRIDFDIIDGGNDRHYCYGSSGWNAQNQEATQSVINPVDPTWGIKVKQQDITYSNRWGGIKAWKINEQNHLLRFHTGEYKGDPANYVDGENTFREDDVIWTTTSTSGKGSINCGPDLFLY